MIDGGPRTATVTAAMRVSTLEIGPAAFRKLLHDEPTISDAIATELEAKLELTGGAVVATGPASAGRPTLEELCRRLRAAEHPDWVQGTAAPRRGLQRMFART